MKTAEWRTVEGCEGRRCRDCRHRRSFHLKRRRAVEGQCVICHCKLTPTPPPAKKQQPTKLKAPRRNLPWYRRRWANDRKRFSRVSIRCAYCFHTYCLRHALKHFGAHDSPRKLAEEVGFLLLRGVRDQLATSKNAKRIMRELGDHS